MGVNKVELSTGETLIDLTEDTVTEDTLVEGATAHNAQGDKIVGKMTPSDEVQYITDEKFENIMREVGI